MILVQCLRYMHVHEYVDLGNGVWMTKREGGGICLHLEQDLIDAGIIHEFEAINQRPQMIIPNAPYQVRDTSGVSPLPFRTVLPRQHRLYLNTTEDSAILEHATLNESLFVSLETLFASGIIRRDSERRYALVSGVRGIVWGEGSNRDWPHTEGYAPMGMLQLQSWEWFDMNDPEDSLEDLNRMLKGVSNLTKVRAIALLFGDSVALRRDNSGRGDGYQDWSFYFPYSLSRISRMSTLLPGCFVGWTASENVIYDNGDSEEADNTDEWVDIYNTLNPDLAAAWDASFGLPRGERLRNLHDTANMANGIGFVEASVEEYNERPEAFTQEQVERFDSIMDRIAPIESVESYEF